MEDGKLLKSNNANDEHGFPPDQEIKPSKFKKLTRNRVTELISTYSHRLKWVLFYEIILLLVATVVEFLHPRWYLIMVLIFGFISLFIGLYGVFKQKIKPIQIFTLFQSIGLIFSFIGTL
eukprot:808348_1